jgi:hypothetical protein
MLLDLVRTPRLVKWLRFSFYWASVQGGGMLSNLVRIPRSVNWLCFYLLVQWPGRGNAARFGTAWSKLGQCPRRGNAA